MGQISVAFPVGTPLKDWDINIYRGVLTGCNEAFIIDTAKRDEIISNCQTEDERKRTAELIRPILRGRDIKRYGYEWAELWLIATFPSRHYNIDEYPAVKQYLLSFGIERLEQTGKTHIVNGEKVKSRKKTHNKWFETQDSISYWEDFNKPKIIYPDICTFLSFELDTSCFYLSNTAYFLITEKEEHLKYFLRVLNSSVMDWYYRTLSVQLGEKAVRMFSIYVLNIPIPPISDEPIEEILKLSKEEKLFISGS